MADIALRPVPGWLNTAPGACSMNRNTGLNQESFGWCEMNIGTNPSPRKAGGPERARTGVEVRSDTERTRIVARYRVGLDRSDQAQ